MIARLIPDASQLRFWAQSALNAFDTLEAETAAEVVRSDVHAILEYLDILERADTITVTRTGEVETRIANELSRA